MLHYYAKRFYRRTLLSPYLEDGLLKLYYVNDDVWTKKPQFHYENLTHSSSGNLKFADAKAHAKNSLEVHEDVVVMRNKAFHMQDEEAVVRIVCYHWSSLEEQTSWQITFQNVRIYFMGSELICLFGLAYPLRLFTPDDLTFSA